MGQFRTSRTFDIIFLLILASLLGLAVVQRTALGDWVFFRTHQPSPQAITTADRANLSPIGRQLFYRTDPTFASAAIVAAQCDLEQLGCITSRGEVYILDEPAKPDQTIVTATHEMLHLAYRRLSKDQKAELVPLLEAAITQNDSTALQDELSHETTPDGRYDEAHSLLGTEYRQLPPALEQYYATYFNNRTEVVDAQTRSQR